MELNPKMNGDEAENLDSRLDKVIEKSNAQTRILRKILNQLNTKQEEGIDLKKMSKKN